jgi:hypothetical protein
MPPKEKPQPEVDDGWGNADEKQEGTKQKKKPPEDVGKQQSGTKGK